MSSKGNYRQTNTTINRQTRSNHNTLEICGLIFCSPQTSAERVKRKGERGKYFGAHKGRHFRIGIDDRGCDDDDDDVDSEDGNYDDDDDDVDDDDGGGGGGGQQ
ncbi:hypothetical protein PoB_004974600 [Plakobranchus ocellatus]|uniref:Uncharacterized protein n=1 Tax=Plakobranchus ocellatus TaxID=259542 RepID=A0AAV4BRZ5_9GAST|nr:hypothetical protein PoB_004974600 [Plakobranchus ocellatus]